MASLVGVSVEFTCECLTTQGACVDGLGALHWYRFAKFFSQVVYLGMVAAGVSRRCEYGCWEGR